jgi:hypothetical protein
MVSGTAQQADAAPSAGTNEDLLRRQAALQDEGREVLAELDLERRLEGFGPLHLAGSFVSGLMVWPELDIGFLGGPELSPADVIAAMGRLVLLPGNCAVPLHRRARPSQSHRGTAR